MCICSCFTLSSVMKNQLYKKKLLPTNMRWLHGVKCNEKLIILKYGKIFTKNRGNVFIRTQRYQTHIYIYMFLTPIKTFEE